jgi:outer membrane beta-barrel protein
MPFFLVLLHLFVFSFAFAEDNEEKAEKVQTEVFKKKYLDNVSGQEMLNIVQNRAYTKKHKLNLGGFIAPMSHDPFLTTLGYGASLGFSFSEMIMIEGIYFSVKDSDSSAAVTLAQTVAANGLVLYPDTNPISSLTGMQLVISALYGKLSFFGAAIMHYDLYFFAGAGSLKTKQTSKVSSSSVVQNSIIPWIGIGQYLFLLKNIALRFDYRFSFYQESIYNVSNANLNLALAKRAVNLHAFTIGVNFFLF